MAHIKTLFARTKFYIKYYIKLCKKLYKNLSITTKYYLKSLLSTDYPVELPQVKKCLKQIKQRVQAINLNKYSDYEVLELLFSYSYLETHNMGSIEYKEDLYHLSIEIGCMWVMDRQLQLMRPTLLSELRRLQKRKILDVIRGQVKSIDLNIYNRYEILELLATPYSKIYNEQNDEKQHFLHNEIMGIYKLLSGYEIESLQEFHEEYIKHCLYTSPSRVEAPEDSSSSSSDNFDNVRFYNCTNQMGNNNFENLQREKAPSPQRNKGIKCVFS